MYIALCIFEKGSSRLPPLFLRAFLVGESIDFDAGEKKLLRIDQKRKEKLTEMEK